MSKFTPGQWAYEFSPDEGFLIVAEKSIVVATTQTEANARLIAAAPALYEALKSILAVAETGRIEVEEVGVFDDARAALALVGGDAS